MINKKIMIWPKLVIIIFSIGCYFLEYLVLEKKPNDIIKKSFYNISDCFSPAEENFSKMECNRQRLEDKYPRITMIWPYHYNSTHYYTTMYLIFNVDSYSEICPMVKAKLSGLYYVCHIEHKNLNISDTEYLMTLEAFAMRPGLISEMPKVLIEKLIARTKLIKERTQTITNYKNFIIERFSEELRKKYE